MKGHDILYGFAYTPDSHLESVGSLVLLSLFACSLSLRLPSAITEMLFLLA